MTSSPSRDAAMFSPPAADFEAIPPTVKRKYFSTLERLRYAQGQLPLDPAATNSTSRNMNVFKPKATVSSKQRPAHLRRPSLFHIRSPVRQTKEMVPESPSLPPESVDWYHRLPEKIQRTAFTTEERYAYAMNARPGQAAAMDDQQQPTSQPFYKNGRQGNRSLPSLSSCSDAGSTRDDVLKTPMEMNDSIFDTFRLLDNDNSLDLNLDEYHSHVAHAANVTKITSAHKRTRTLTQSSLPRPRPSLERGRTIETGPRTIIHEISSHPRSMSPVERVRSSSKSSVYSTFLSRSISPGRLTLLERRSLKRASSQSRIPPVPPIDPNATHVSDPATRFKLRLYLSSAAKFDEALEFGFPSLSGSTPSQPNFLTSRPSTASYLSHRRSLSVGAVSLSVRRSLSSAGNTKRESMAIGTTFFYDDDESDDEDESAIVSDVADTETVKDSISVHNTGIDSDSTAADYYDLPLGIAELPAEVPEMATFLESRPSTVATKDIILSTAALLPGPASPPGFAQHKPRLSRSISLKPRLQTNTDGPSMTALPPLPKSAKDFTASGRNQSRSPKVNLKPWMEPDDAFAEREMTLRLTLTRKDLRADESLIYPDGGNGSWDSPTSYRYSDDQDRDPASGKWRFWSKRR